VLILDVFRVVNFCDTALCQVRQPDRAMIVVFLQCSNLNPSAPRSLMPSDQFARKP